VNLDEILRCLRVEMTAIGRTLDARSDRLYERQLAVGQALSNLSGFLDSAFWDVDADPRLAEHLRRQQREGDRLIRTVEQEITTTFDLVDAMYARPVLDGLRALASDLATEGIDVSPHHQESRMYAVLRQLVSAARRR
jgi:hypothetical protein